MAYSGPRHGGWPQTGRVDDGWPQKSQVNDRRQEAPPQNIPAVRLRSPSIELCERESSSDDDGEISFGTDLECWHYDLSAAPALNRYGQSTPDMYWPSPGALDPTTYTFPNQHRPRNAGIVQSKSIGEQGFSPKSPRAFPSTLHDVELGFVRLNAKDFAGCERYIQKNPDVLREDEAILNEAADALSHGDEVYARRCLWKALMIRDYNERELFFSELAEDNTRYEEFRVDFEEAWEELKNFAGKITRITSSNNPNLETGEVSQAACTYTPTPPTSDRDSERPQRMNLPSSEMPAYQNRVQTTSPHESPTEPANGATFGLSDYMATFSSMAGWLVGKRSKAMEEAKVEQPHPSSRRSPAFGTQWIDIYAPKAEENWPIARWPYIPTLAFLDSGSRGNVNSVSKDFLVEQLKISYKPTDDKVRGHAISFTPLGVAQIKFHPIEINARGEAKADIPITLSFYVHDENDLFGEILLGSDYIESREDRGRIGLPTYKETKKMNPAQQKAANDSIAKRDAASQRVMEANNNANYPSGSDGHNLYGQQSRYQHGSGN